MELVHECSPEHLRMGTARFKLFVVRLCLSSHQLPRLVASSAGFMGGALGAIALGPICKDALLQVRNLEVWTVSLPHNAHWRHCHLICQICNFLHLSWRYWHLSYGGPPRSISGAVSEHRPINVVSQPGIEPGTLLFQDNHEAHYATEETRLKYENETEEEKKIRREEWMWKEVQRIRKI